MSDSLSLSDPSGPARYILEILTPRQETVDLDAALAEFARRYERILAEGHVVSVPDNPLGRLHFTALEVIAFKDLQVRPGQLLLHLNSFHRKVDLDETLAQADELGVQNILCVSGDGGPRLPKLEPHELGSEAKAVSSVELLRYVHSSHPGRFTLGVAFNPYEPLEHEMAKLRNKVEAGAAFVATQPVIGENPAIRELLAHGLPVYLGAWMSPKVQLLEECVGYPVEEVHGAYDPVQNLARLQELYDARGCYLSLLSFKAPWPPLLSRDAAREPAFSRG